MATLCPILQEQKQIFCRAVIHFQSLLPLATQSTHCAAPLAIFRSSPAWQLPITMLQALSRTFYIQNSHKPQNILVRIHDCYPILQNKNGIEGHKVACSLSTSREWWGWNSNQVCALQRHHVRPR